MSRSARIDDFARLAVTLAAVTVAALGLMVIIGWYTHTASLLQLHPAFVPMQFNTALCFLLGGLGLLVLSGRPSLAMAFGGLVAVVGLLTVAEYITGKNIGIDQLLMEHYITTQTSHPGRMAPNTALCFVLSGVGLLVLGGRARWGAMGAGVLGSAILALGLVASFGYLTGFETTYGWGHLTRMALHTAAGFTVLGAGLFTKAWRDSDAEASGSPSWLPIPAALAVATISIVLWQALVIQEHAQVARVVQVEVTKVQGEIQEIVSSRIDALERMGKRWEQEGGTPKEEWEADAALYLAHGLGYETIKWIDAASRVRWVVPEGHYEADQAFNLALSAEQRARLETSQVSITRAENVRHGGIGHLVQVPLFVDEVSDGFLIGVFRLEALLAPIFSEAMAQGYSVTLYAGAEELYGQYDPERPYEAQWSQERELSFYETTWRIRIWPRSELVAQMRNGLPGGVMVVGLLMALLVGLTIRMTQTAQSQTRAMERANQLLEAEICERKQAEQARYQSEQLFQTSFDHASIGMALVGIDGQWLRVNRALCQIIGYSDAELLDKTFQDLTHPDDLDADLAYIEQMLEGQIETYQMEKRYFHKDGYVVWVLLSVSAVPLEEGRIEYFISQIQDITERKQAVETLKGYTDELERSNRELERSNEELEQFAYVASHDLQEPLRMVISYTQLLARRYQDQLDEAANEFIDYAVDGATRMQKLITDLLSFSRVRTKAAPLAETDPNVVLQQTLKNVQARIDERDAHITFDTLPTVMADATQLGQLFQNLLGNALKFSEQQPEIHLGVTEQEEQWEFYVRDNGIGIDPVYAERIFDVFQRLHGKGEYAGTGIGLSICRKIAERHGGRIWVESEAGKGTTFFFTLPKHLPPLELDIRLAMPCSS